MKPLEIEKVLNAFCAKDLELVMSFFAEDARVYDPHYPEPEMQGLAAIRRGFAWGLGNMEKPGFVIRHCWLDGEKAVLEMDTHHVFKGGMEVKFPQVFVIEMQNGKITRLQAYVPYSPPGLGGVLTKLTRLKWKLQGKV